MAKSRKKIVKVAQTKPIQVGFYQLDDGIVGEVTTGAWLGSVLLYKRDDGTYGGKGVFHGKEYPIVAVIKSVGTIPTYRRFTYNSEELDPVQPIENFLPFLDEYRKEKLTPEQLAKLSSISLVDLHKIQKDFFEANLGNWTSNWNPWIDAVNSIMQLDNGMNENFPKRKYVVVPHYQEEDGHKVVGADITLFVNDAKFVAGEGGVSYCNGATYKYFSWDAAVGVFPDGELYYPPLAPGEDE